MMFILETIWEMNVYLDLRLNSEFRYFLSKLIKKNVKIRKKGSVIFYIRIETTLTEGVKNDKKPRFQF